MKSSRASRREIFYSLLCWCSSRPPSVVLCACCLTAECPLVQPRRRQNDEQMISECRETPDEESRLGASLPSSFFGFHYSLATFGFPFSVFALLPLGRPGTRVFHFVVEHLLFSRRSERSRVFSSTYRGGNYAPPRKQRNSLAGKVGPSRSRCPLIFERANPAAFRVPSSTRNLFLYAVQAPRP